MTVKHYTKLLTINFSVPLLHYMYVFFILNSQYLSLSS